MTGLEIILVSYIVALMIVFYISRKRHDKRLEDLHWQLHCEKNNIHQLANSGALDSLLNVNKFNDWFNSPKDKSIYAHTGIFLRTDKLSKHHFDDYIKMSTFGYVTYEDFDFSKMLEFEERVRKNWMKQLSEQ